MSLMKWYHPWASLVDPIRQFSAGQGYILVIDSTKVSAHSSPSHDCGGLSVGGRCRLIWSLGDLIHEGIAPPSFRLIYFVATGAKSPHPIRASQVSVVGDGEFNHPLIDRRILSILGWDYALRVRKCNTLDSCQRVMMSNGSTTVIAVPVAIRTRCSASRQTVLLTQASPFPNPSW